MPCNSDYMEPTQKEKLLQETAQLCLYVYEKLHIPAPKEIKKAAKDIYCSFDSVPNLCKLLGDLEENVRDSIVYNAKDPKSRQLANWWEQHQEADRIRIEEELKNQKINNLIAYATSKLSLEELLALVCNPEISLKNITFNTDNFTIY